ncbi:hypothetical protein EV207_11516 [Scopulibacillus darangshiensis]|uniref:HNH endonuclease n=1 Tax=Scopulibacillus darangshiensis TaxID=442528 RepID=A0A4R2P4D4_9BACL|nr:hypothetical protein [Scopulibacillus darangshiensis]TCP28791.1 hypothetical protein EV207_11516 [Scopulibacillus darangshiensis]
MKYEIRKTPKTRQFELVHDGEVVQKVCRSCGHVKLIEDFHRYSAGHTRPDCRDCHNKRQRKYIQNIKLKRIAYRNNSRARLQGAPDTLTEQDVKELFEFADGKCMISGKECETFEVDHLQALSKCWLGSTAGNVILVSPGVNRKKGTLSIFEFAKSESSKGLIDLYQLRKTFDYLASKYGITTERYVGFLLDCEELAKRQKELLSKN